MSDIFGTPRPRQPRPPAGRRQKVLVPTLITLAVLLFLGSIFTSVWTDRLWFKSVGYSDVFRSILFTRISMFVSMGLIFGLFVMVNLYLAFRTRPESVPVRRDDPAYRYRLALTPIIRPIGIGVFVVLTAFSGSVGASHWDTFKTWRNATPFGIKDPQFGKDVGFYTFDYPWWRFITSFSFAMIIVTVLAVVFVNYVYGGIRIAGRGPKLTRSAQIHLSVLVGLGILTRAVSYYLDRFGLLVANGGLVDGGTFTDINARIPAKNILIWVAIACALLFFASIFIRSWALPAIGLGLLAVSSILLGAIWPAIMQGFQVKPSEPDKEAPYIARNIEATRQAYDVADTQVESYSATTDLTPEALAASAESRVSTRLLDPTLISDAFEQLQQVRGYYSVPKTLDVDRYTLPGETRPQDTIIAARELNLSGLQANQRNWANDHTVYTHGYGIIAARGNQRGPNGEPVFTASDIPQSGEIETSIPPRIYFGEQSPSYSIVGRPKGSAPIEVDIPRGGSASSDSDSDTSNVTQNTYDGKGGVPVGNLFHKVLYAFKFAEPNIVLSGRVNADSKILYDREPRDRVKKVAPWLTVDGDTYPAVVDGRVVWIVDGYTTSNSYPYSEHRSLREATADTLTDGNAQAALPTDQVNYMRNSVKAVVDAYDGTVKLYEWDTKDPVLKTWKKVFPGVIESKSSISTALLEHLRYPVDLFKVQRDVLQRYHVTDAQTFYEDGERWKVPEDPTAPASSRALQPPYYLSTARPGETDPKFSVTSVYLPNSRQNLAAFVSVNSEATDTENFGKMQILQLPSETQIPGPSQIANSFQTDRGVTQALLQFEQSREARILRGNLLTLPVGGSLLYVQPVYIQRSASEGSFPVLQFVAATFGESVGFGTTLDEALKVALGIEQGTTPPAEDGEGDTPDQPTDGGGGGGADTPAKTTAQWLAEASAAYNDAQAALEKGDLAGYQSKINAMNTAIEGAQDSLGTAK
ncbi:UPF0182 family membrane protein [Aeromicrobium fastidiosum]|uniref:UPF0182 protein ESP62_018335 n=1 Tax=Aeromicrobium fastidiosum TaxID=52699 RepID=A0A641AH96_9ACTN|nr:UPF0182 family protein [Aeromicrobium fastidiosum]KAA1373045.1 UPF0182 family protein [Aeromicrobium fastidiosum]MBP2391026.1 uncharacterized membrane protein (UPF0182 family) [Aeromicrobium fastidiosum]